MNSYEALLENLKKENTQIDWDDMSILMENTLDGTFLDGKLVDRDDYYMIVNKDGTLNFMAYEEQVYLPLFTATFMFEDKVVMVFTFNKQEEDKEWIE